MLRSNKSVSSNPLFAAASRFLDFGRNVGNSSTRAAAPRARNSFFHGALEPVDDLDWDISPKQMAKIQKRLERRNADGMTDAEFIEKYL